MYQADYVAVANRPSTPSIRRSIIPVRSSRSLGLRHDPRMLWDRSLSMGESVCSEAGRDDLAATRLSLLPVMVADIPVSVSVHGVFQIPKR